MVRWLVEHFQLTRTDVLVPHCLHQACEQGDLGFAQWLHIKFRLCQQDLYGYVGGSGTAFSMCCSKGSLELAQWLVAVCGMTAEGARVHCDRPFRLACENGHLDVAQWLVTAFHAADAASIAVYVSDWSLNCYKMTLRTVCANGHLHVAQWLVCTIPGFFHMLKNDIDLAFYHACACGQLEFVQWLAEAFNVTAKTFKRLIYLHPFLAACENGHLKVLQWLAEAFQLTTTTTKLPSLKLHLMQEEEEEEEEKEEKEDKHSVYFHVKVDVAIELACRNNNGGNAELIQWLESRFSCGECVGGDDENWNEDGIDVSDENENHDKTT